MVDLTLTDEQKDLRELAHSFAEKDIRKVAWDYDKDGTWPQDIIDKAWEVGLMNTHIAEEYGGPGLDFLSGCLIEEEMGWGCSGIGTSLMANGLAATPVALGGTEEVKKKYLGMLTESAKLASFCLTEPDAGSDVSGMKTTAGEEGRQVRPQRLQVLHHQRRLRRLVHRLRQDRQGRRPPRHLRLRRPPRTTRSRSTRRRTSWVSAPPTRATITFNETRGPRGNLLGEENHGFKLAMMTLDRTRPGVAAMAVGIARAALEFAVDYSKERVQFGVPIAMHQAISLHDRRHGDQGRGRPPAHLAVRRGCSTRASATPRRLARQALRRRLRDGGHHRRRAGLRRLRLHQGVPGREADARRQDHAALRGHLADPAPGDRQGAPDGPPGRRGDARRRRSFARRPSVRPPKSQQEQAPATVEFFPQHLLLTNAPGDRGVRRFGAESADARRGAAQRSARTMASEP